MNQVTQVNILNGDVKFTYEDGSVRLLSEDQGSEYLTSVDATVEPLMKFATPQRRLAYVANRHFN